MLTNVTLRQIGHRFKMPAATITGWQQSGVPKNTAKLIEAILEADVKIAQLEQQVSDLKTTVRTLTTLLQH